MKVLINGKDIKDTLSKFQDDHVTIEIKSNNREHTCMIGGVVRIENEHIDVPYNPLTDTDCGTDAMMAKQQSILTSTLKQQG